MEANDSVGHIKGQSPWYSIWVTIRHLAFTSVSICFNARPVKSKAQENAKLGLDHGVGDDGRRWAVAWDPRVGTVVKKLALGRLALPRLRWISVGGNPWSGVALARGDPCKSRLSGHPATARSFFNSLIDSLNHQPPRYLVTLQSQGQRAGFFTS